MDQPAKPEPPSKLNHYWDRPVSELVALSEPAISSEQEERHRIYLLMLMALIDLYWNSFKHGRAGDYPWNGKQDPSFPYEYKGHNIAAIAVDGNGRVLDFDFNHNKLFNSSAEHAEARLVRRMFALSQIADVYDEIKTTQGPRLGEYDLLSEVTVYTSLESCAQCAGMMALGNVKAVVYLQADPGMYMIGNILRNLSGEMPQAPRPIKAESIGLDRHVQDLENGFRDFPDLLKKEPFWTSPDSQEPDKKALISSFLCTLRARQVFDSGRSEFEELVSGQASLQYPDELSRDRNGQPVANSLTNQQVLENSKRFLDYARVNGRRGTPHRV